MKEEKKNLAIGLGIVVAIIAVIAGVVAALLPVESETAQEELKNIDPDKEAKLDTEEEVLDFIFNYKGTDGLGPTLDQTVTVIMNVAYPDEDIFLSPATKVSFTASKDYSREISDRYWNVEGKIMTYRETVYLKWAVDTETNSVYPGNEDGKNVLDILDNLDK